MEILIQAAQLILSLSILVIIHEFGHFLFAKIFKTRVEKFYLFFNPWFSVFKFKKGETEYGMGWLPLGGYVKISGMIDESMDKEQLKKPPQPYEFRSKKAYQRLLIMLGGVLMNFLLAILIYSATLYVWGEQYLPTQSVKYGITVDSLGYASGFRSGDKIISVDNEKIADFYEIIPHYVLNDGQSVQVERDGEIINIHISDDILPELLNDPNFIDVRIPFTVADFEENSVGKESGFMIGDTIISFEGRPVQYFDEVRSIIEDYKNQEITIQVKRGQDTVTLTPVVPESGLLGIYPDWNLSNHFKLESMTYGFWESIPAGIDKGYNTFVSYLKQLKLIFSPKTEAYKSVGGFITIGKIFPRVWNWQAFWKLTAFLSIILGIINVLPIPALDGGHAMFLFFELITGRKPSDKVMEYAQIIGLVLLLALILYANGNDIVKLFNK